MIAHQTGDAKIGRMYQFLARQWLCWLVTRDRGASPLTERALPIVRRGRTRLHLGCSAAESPSQFNPPAGRYVMFRQDHPVLGAVSALISDTDNKAASPEQLNLLFDAGIQELEPFGELGRRGNLEASAGCRQIDHRAVDDRLFRIDNDLARLRHHAVRPDADKSAEFAQNGTSNAT